MHYADQWKALSARIRGLSEAAEFDHRLFANNNTGDWQFLSLHAAEIVGALKGLKATLEEADHATAALAVERVLDHNKIKMLQTLSEYGDNREKIVRSCVVALRAFEAEMTFLLSDTQQNMRTRSERAFRHLNWQIAVDDEVRDKWRTAFTEGETQCEKLGAVHLLWHGIFAFKIDANKGRTDLVFGEPLDGQETYADALVLTEWKKATKGDAGKKFGQAVKQAEKYAHGPLAENELRSYRYAIVVTEQQVERPPDHTHDGVTYRHVNIAVDPHTPSRAARATTTVKPPYR